MQIDYAAIAPEIVVASMACVVLVGDLVLRGRERRITPMLSMAALAVALIDLLKLVGTTPRATFGDMFVLDGFALVLKAFFLSVGLIVVWISMPVMSGHRYEGEYYFLLLCSVLGTMLMPSSRELLMLFLSLELISAPAFVLAGIRKRNPRSNEAALKFFLFGVLSAGVLVYGISLVYGFAGTTSLAGIARRAVAPEPLLLTGIVFIIAAFGFKVSAVPFHFWAPDTYEGSPTPLAAFLSVASKAAGFAGLALILLVGVPTLQPYWGPLVGGLAVATMTVGNVLALRQRHLVRLLAYSSIAHAGYMLIPLALVRPNTTGFVSGTNADIVRALVVYFLIYGTMNIGAFAVAIGVSKEYPTLLVRDLAGLGRRAPLHAIALTGFMISLGGIPPFAGWVAKFFIFIAAVNVGSTMGIVLAAMMVVNSVVSLYYYVGVVRAMYFQPSEASEAVRFAPAITLAVAVCFAAVLVFGVLPELVVKVARAAQLVLVP